MSAELAEEITQEETEESPQEPVVASAQVPEWASDIENEGLRDVAAKFKSRDELLSAIGVDKVDADWREGLPEDLSKTAQRFASKDDAIRAIQAFQKREGQIRVPGKDATEKELSSYYKSIGVPEKPEGYVFPVLAENEMTEEVKASRQEWAKRFHDMHVPADTAKALIEFVAADADNHEKKQIELDKSFVKSQEDALRSEWKGEEFDKNKTIANRAFEDIAKRAGVNLEQLTSIETKDGRFLMDRAEMLKLFALIGREMSEGTLGPVLSDSDVESIEDEIRSVRDLISEAQSKGDSKRANTLFQREQSLIAKKQGNKSVVGAGGRAV